jgi:hypothetical protein
MSSPSSSKERPILQAKQKGVKFQLLINSDLTSEDLFGKLQQMKCTYAGQEAHEEELSWIQKREDLCRERHGLSLHHLHHAMH